MSPSLDESLCDAGQKHLRVPKHYRRILFKGLWNYLRLTLGFLRKDPNVEEWDGSIWMGEEAGWKEKRKIMGSCENSG